jgi:4-hydroxybenzoate polyprenyltransferase
LISWNSPVIELAAYARERIAKVRIVLLVAFVAGLGFAVEPTGDWRQVLLRVALVALLVVQFRLWDDIADREHDRLRHPGRVLQRHAGRATHFFAVLGLLSIPIVGLLFTFANPEWRIGAYGVLALAVAVVYGTQATAHGRVMRMGWVLLKYPVFVLLPLAAPGSPNAWVAAAIAYLVVMMYDWATSPDAADMRRAHLRAPRAEMFEPVACYACGGAASTPFLNGDDDLTGKPGRFTFVRCRNCRLAYLNPRLKRQYIAHYDDPPVDAARARAGWGWLTPLYERLLDRYERDKAVLVERLIARSGGSVLDEPVRQGVAELPAANARGFELITMWNSLEHDYDPLGTLRAARDRLARDGRLLIEVPCLDSFTSRLYHERWPGLQAPRNTVLFTRQSLDAMVDAAGLEVVSHVSYGAFPPYLYVFAGAAFRLLKGRPGNAQRALPAFVLGRVAAFPAILLARRLDLATQTVVCRRRT